MTESERPTTSSTSAESAIQRLIRDSQGSPPTLRAVTNPPFSSRVPSLGTNLGIDPSITAPTNTSPSVIPRLPTLDKFGAVLELDVSGPSDPNAVIMLEGVDITRWVTNLDISMNAGQLTTARIELHVQVNRIKTVQQKGMWE